jgi:hypothetical protein
MAMTRKKIYIEPIQDVLVRRLGETRGTTESEIIRKALDALVRTSSFCPHRLEVWRQERDFISRLMDQGAAF